MAGFDHLALIGDSVQAARQAGRAVPFAIVSLAHGRVVGSTRFYEIDRWRAPIDDATPTADVDACMVGYTWLAASAQRTACNTEAKLLMLTHAFEHWGVHRVGFRIDARNEPSRAARGTEITRVKMTAGHWARFIS